MSEWDTGYVGEIAYTFGYCDELNPVRLRLPLLRAGLAVPDVRVACELGFGHGVSVNVHAAGSASQWYGTDFNPSHASFAQQLADCSGSHAQLSGESFSAFCQRDDLPDFDFIGLHGTWSWISEENRALIADFIRRKLKAGGVVYVSYNAQPGCATMLPVRELMHAHFRSSAMSESHDGITPEERLQTRIRAAVEFAQTVFATQPGYALVNPLLAERVDGMSGESLNYLAHEYFNRDWQPMFFSQVASSLGAAGLTYGGSADYRDHIDEVNLTSSQRELVASIADTCLRETARDLCVNRSFRRDYWVKEPRTLSHEEQQAALRAHRVILALPSASVVLKVRGALGETSLAEGLYDPILDVLSSHRAMTLREIEESVRDRSIALTQIVTAVTLLISMGVLLNAQEEARIADARPSADRLNAAICERAIEGADIQFLVSPVSSSGILMPRIPQLFLLAKMRGMQRPDQWAEFAETTVRMEPRPMGSPTDSTSVAGELAAKAERFAKVHLPILEALGIG